MTAPPVTTSAPAADTPGRPRILTTPAADVVAVGGAPRRMVAMRLSWPVPATADGRYPAALEAFLRSAAPGEPALVEQLETAGATGGAGVTPVAAYLEFGAPRETASAVLRLVAGALAGALVGADAVRTALTVLRHQAGRRRHDVRSLADDHFRRLRFVDGPFTVPPTGTEEGLAGLTVPRVQDALAALATRVRPTLVLVGDPDPEPYAEALAVAGVASAAAGVASGEAPARSGEDGEPVPEEGRPLLGPHPPAEASVPAAGAGQGHLRWGIAVGTDDATDLAVVEIALHVLAGWSGSRWERRFREQERLTYGVSAEIGLWRWGAPALVGQVGMTVAPDLLPRTRDLVGADAEAYLRTGPAAAEITAAARRLLRQEALHLDSAAAALRRAAWFWQARLPADYPAARMRALREMEPDLFRARFHRLVSRPTLLVVGPAPATRDGGQT